MVYFVRSGTMADGKRKEATEFGLKVSKYLKENCPEIKSIEVLWNISGTRNKIHWLIKYESLAKWEKGHKQLEGDSAWQALVAEAAGLLIPPGEDSFYEVAE